ncbi:hypothetical protein BBK36DRAFT_1143690 [Trichoderma citrinoviride]|uniref:Uncharacterized protein n=1 Tax=Trichoderma citrinoviride TaxID=58853 RepID=A0A2T4B3S4_9HYPO|nr:hypothetical protein BBK36DRAFT_1143690 [Trichoderma citrinoviride]PTB63983.1 hypothetical protein BBK36DRAFT_1143690 [Trichoderma citrinoviride]
MYGRARARTGHRHAAGCRVSSGGVRVLRVVSPYEARVGSTGSPARTVYFAACAACSRPPYDAEQTLMLPSSFRMKGASKLQTLEQLHKKSGQRQHAASTALVQWRACATQIGYLYSGLETRSEYLSSAASGGRSRSQGARSEVVVPAPCCSFRQRYLDRLSRPPAGSRIATGCDRGNVHKYC